MLRFAFNALTLLSLLIFILAAGFWVRGQYTSDYLSRQSPASYWTLGGSRSGIGLLVITRDVAPSTPTPAGDILAGGDVQWARGFGGPEGYEDGNPIRTAVVADESGPEVNCLHIVVAHRRLIFHTPGAVLYVHIPYWLILLLSAVLPATWLIRRRIIPRRRRRLGLCVHCGYDLRGEAAHCPECGLPSGYAVSSAT